MTTNYNSTEAVSPAFLVVDFIDSVCSTHKTNNLSYLQWQHWAEQKTKQGAKQKQCQKCGRWYFREEF